MLKVKQSKTLNRTRKSGTYVDFECLDSVVQQQYVAHNLCVLPVSLQFRRPDIVGSASRQAEARAHHAPTRVCNKPTHSREEKLMSERNKRANSVGQKKKWSIMASMFGMYTYYMTIQVCYDKKTP